MFTPFDMPISLITRLFQEKSTAITPISSGTQPSKENNQKAQSETVAKPTPSELTI